MKKVIFVALLSFLGFTQADAQVSFKPGVRAGINFSHFTQTDNPNEKFSSKTDFYAGVFGALQLSKFYTLQPELVFTKQGSEYEYIDSDNKKFKETIDLSYISVGVANKFTFNRFNFVVGPTVDVRINDNNKSLNATYNDSYDYYYDDYNGIDFAFFVGAGVEITKNFGIEARIKKGIIPVNGDWDYTNVVYQVGLNYAFDIKK
ncbi:porin family protein [Flavobacterium enshiense]|uniref:porin family protein n=1 Tax=Flavobacterium enshiense TaxID=1341165 RepID=UPI00345D8C8F